MTALIIISGFLLGLGFGVLCLILSLLYKKIKHRRNLYSFGSVQDFGPLSTDDDIKSRTKKDHSAEGFRQ